MKSTQKIVILGILGIPAIFATAHGALVAHFKLDEGSGATTAFNELGNNAAGYNASVFGAVTTGVAGKIGNAYQFDGVSGNHVLLDNPAFLNTINAGDSLSISAWVRQNGGTSPASVVSFGNKAVADQYYQLSTNGSNARVVNRTSNFETTQGNDIINNNLWHHLVGTVSYDGANTTLQIYVDGVLDSSRTYVDGPPNTLNVFTLGVLSRNNTGLDDRFVGLIDDVQLYDGVLSANQVALLFQNPGAVVPEPGTAMLSLLCLPILLRRKR